MHPTFSTDPKNKNVPIFDCPTEGYISGQWISTDDTFQLSNPATSKIIAEVAECSPAHAMQALSSADETSQSWADTPAHIRAEYLERCADSIETHLNELATLTTTEQGKPIKESLSEWKTGAQQLRWFGQLARQNCGNSLPMENNRHLRLTIHEPVGVVLAITTWNFPVLSVVMKVGAALAAGCCVLVKPSELTPLSALAIGKLMTQAQLPSGVLNILPTTNPGALCEPLLQDHRLKALSFTGSAEVGKTLSALASHQVKHVELELGGNAPFIVFEDADIALAAKHLVGAKFYNCGQICVGANRIYIHESIEQEFVSQFTEYANQLKIGHGLDPDIDCGPMIDHRAVDKSMTRLEQALKCGAELNWQAKIPQTQGSFFPPTILRKVTHTMPIRQEEIFAPIAAIGTFRDKAEAFHVANQTHAGLAAYLYTQDDQTKFESAKRLKAGMIGCNTTDIFDQRLAFGGCDQSGHGREGGLNALKAFSIEKNFSLRY